MEIRHKLWLEDESGVLFGAGRYELLKAVSETGSLSAAAKQMSMSYRAAWGRLRASEDRMGLKLLEPAGKGRSLALTETGRRLVDNYSRFEEKAAEAISQVGQKIFGDQDGKLSLDGPDRNR